MVHQYQNNGYRIVLDVNSGSVHVVDPIAYDAIAVLNRLNGEHTVESLQSEGTWRELLDSCGDMYSEEDLREVLEAVTELTRQERLFTPDIYEEYIEEVKQRKTVVKT